VSCFSSARSSFRAASQSGRVTMVPKGRDEDELEHTMEWVRYHDSYETGAKCGCHPKEAKA